MSKLETAKRLLTDSKATLVVIAESGEEFTSEERGVKPLVYLLEHEPRILKGASVADKVVGKAAALLMVLGDIKEINTGVISTPAMEVFEKHNITYFFNKKVERIVNRKGDGLCPMETLCLDIEEPANALLKIKAWQERQSR